MMPDAIYFYKIYNIINSLMRSQGLINALPPIEENALV